jgi:hypothetical protein
VERVWKWGEFDGVVCGCGWDALEWHTVLDRGTEGRGGESHYRKVGSVVRTTDPG